MRPSIPDSRTHRDAKSSTRLRIRPEDRRQILVTLTEGGLGRAGAVFGAMSKTEESLLNRLGERALGRLNDDLRELLVVLEGPAPPPA